MQVAEKNTEYASGRDYYEMKKAELKEITDKLEQGVAEIFSSDRYKEMLNMLAKFPEYSANNSLLIMLQKPNAQLCQSFTGWKSMDRYVKKGEKGIKILAPTPYTILKDVPKESLPTIAKALREPFVPPAAEEETQPVLIPCKNYGADTSADQQ